MSRIYENIIFFTDCTTENQMFLLFLCISRIRVHSELSIKFVHLMAGQMAVHRNGERQRLSHEHGNFCPLGLPAKLEQAYGSNAKKPPGRHISYQHQPSRLE